MRLRANDDAVSSVVGTVLMLGITVTVFTAVSVVVLSYVQAQPESPRTEVQALSEADGERYLLLLSGGESLGPETRVVYDYGSSSRETTVADLMASGALDDRDNDGRWDIGEYICIAGPSGCAEVSSPTSLVQGSLVVAHNTVIAYAGDLSPQAGASGQPDLTVALVSQSPSSAGVGQSVTWTVRVANEGDGDAESVPLLVRISVDGVQVATATAAGPLAAGATVDATSTPGWVATLGGHTLALTVDPLAAVAESDDANNVADSAFTVAAGITDPGQPFLDTNGDGLYTAGTDSLIPTADITDCAFDAGTNGLTIPPSVGAISASSCDFAAAESIVINVSLTTTSGNLDITGDDVTVSPGVTLDAQGTLYIVPADEFVGDGATFVADGAIRIGSTSPGQLGVTASLVGASIDNTQGSGEVQVHVESGAIDLTDATILSKGAIDIGGATSGHQAASVVLSGASLDNTQGSSSILVHYVSGTLTATGAGTEFLSKGAIEFTAGGAIDVSQATFDNDGGSSRVRLEGTSITATSTAISSKGQIELVATGPISAVGANLDNDQGSSALTLTSSTAIDLTSAQLHAKGQIQVAATTGLTLTNAVVENSAGSSSMTLSTTSGSFLCNPCTATTGGGSLTMTGAAMTLTGAVLTTGGSNNVLAVTTSTGALSAAGVTATTSGGQTWRATAGGGITLDGATLAAPGRNLVACLPSSGYQLSISGTLSFTDANNKLDVQRNTCGTNAYSSTYITPWNASTQAVTE